MSSDKAALPGDGEPPAKILPPLTPDQVVRLRVRMSVDDATGRSERTVSSRTLLHQEDGDEQYRFVGD